MRDRTGLRAKPCKLVRVVVYDALACSLFLASWCAIAGSNPMHLIAKKKTPSAEGVSEVLVEMKGFEPSASALRTLRSPS